MSLGLRFDERVVERFWRNVQRGDGCWLWIGAAQGKGRSGPGVMVLGGKYVRVHRIAYELQIGPIPAGVDVIRTCGNRLCVRAEHLALLRPGEPLPPSQRARCLRGEAVPTAKLTRDQVVELRQRLARGAEQANAIARAYGISVSELRQIARGTAWSHIEGPLQQQPRPRSNTGYRGVSYLAREGRYRVTIGHGGQRLILAYVDDPEEGARIYDAKARELHGARARLNFEAQPSGD